MERVAYSVVGFISDVLIINSPTDNSNKNNKNLIILLDWGLFCCCCFLGVMLFFLVCFGFLGTAKMGGWDF